LWDPQRGPQLFIRFLGVKGVGIVESHETEKAMNSEPMGAGRRQPLLLDHYIGSRSAIYCVQCVRSSAELSHSAYQVSAGGASGAN